MNNAIDKIIIPTVGRQVWFTPNEHDPLFDADPAPFSATVARVFSERCVNLMVLGRMGKTYERGSVLLKQEGIEYDPVSSYCQWMPYQKGQPAATPMTAAMVRTLIKEALEPGCLYDGATLQETPIDLTTGVLAPTPEFIGRRERERNAVHDRANETLVRNLQVDAQRISGVGLEPIGRNELFEGFFDGETESDRSGRLARAARGLSPAATVDVMEDGVWIAGETGGFAPAGAELVSALGLDVNVPVLLAFSVALEVLKEGVKIARLGWNGKGLWLELQLPDAHSKMTLPYIFMSYPEDAQTTPGARVPWLASQTDLLADDWVLIA